MLHLKRAAVGALMCGVVAGCDSVVPTQAGIPAVVGPTVSAVVPAAEIAALSDALDDARTRLVPSLGGGPGATELSEVLGGLSAELRADRLTGVLQQLGSVRVLLPELARSADLVEHQPDLAHLGLIVTQAAVLLGLGSADDLQNN